MSYHSSQNSYRVGSRSSESDPPSGASSGTITPTGTSSSSSAFLPSSVSSLWGGLVRRFSAETPLHSTSSSPSSSFHHARTMPDGNVHRYDGVDGVYTPPHVQRTASPMAPPPLEPVQLNGYAQDTAPDARLLTSTIAEEIRIMVPMRLAIVEEWNLVYSLDQDGASLATLYEKCAHFHGKRVGFLLVVKDCEGGVSADGDPSLPLSLGKANTAASRSLAPTSPTIHTPPRNTLATASASSGELLSWPLSRRLRPPTPPI